MCSSHFMVYLFRLITIFCFNFLFPKVFIYVPQVQCTYVYFSIYFHYRKIQLFTTLRKPSKQINSHIQVFKRPQKLNLLYTRACLYIYMHMYKHILTLSLCFVQLITQHSLTLSPFSIFSCHSSHPPYNPLHMRY